MPGQGRRIKSRSSRESRRGRGEAERERETFDDAARFQQERGEALRELPRDAVGEMKAEQREHGAKARIGRGLAETRQEIGDELRPGLSFPAGKKESRSKAAFRDQVPGVRNQVLGM